MGCHDKKRGWDSQINFLPVTGLALLFIGRAVSKQGPDPPRPTCEKAKGLRHTMVGIFVPEQLDMGDTAPALRKLFRVIIAAFPSLMPLQIMRLCYATLLKSKQKVYGLKSKYLCLQPKGTCYTLQGY